jgi:radical SAM protein with 4Fe4S-binding SPASM domain
MYHPEVLAQWLKSFNNWEIAKKIYPIYVEISPSGICNHRCRFCAVDYLGYNKGFANFKNLKKAISDMKKGGVKSIHLSGEGEPLLYPKIKDLILYINSLKIDVALTTNGAYLKKELVQDILPALTWIKVSLDAGTSLTHFKIHRPKKEEFSDILKNLEETAEARKKTKTKCTLGGQLLLLEENYSEAEILAKKLKKIGFDYLVIKPYSQHPKSKNKEFKNINYKKYLFLGEKLSKFNDKNFEVIFRKRTIEKIFEKKSYCKCHAAPFFWAHLATNGDIYSCGNFIGDKRFKLGNYNEQPFKKIWEGKTRKKHWEFMSKEFNPVKCRENCRMDEINCYLEKLKNPPEHINFI